MRTVRLVIAALAAGALVPLLATAASAAAAPPSNDKIDGARAITLGQVVKENTSAATTGSMDAKVNQVCGAPFTNASVWFTYTPSTDGSFILDMSQSNYTGGFMIFRNQANPRGMIACGPTTVGAQGKAGVKYFVMAFSDTQVNGGNLVMSLQAGPPSPTVAVTLNPTGKAYADGTAQVSGTFTCTNADFLDLEGGMTQIWKRVKINGYFSRFLQPAPCDGSAHPWKARVESDNGLFAPGDADVDMFVGACGVIECTETDFSQSVSLTKAGQAPADQALVSASKPLPDCDSRWAAATPAASHCQPAALSHAKELSRM